MAFGTDESVLFREVSLIQGVLIESICITHELEEGGDSMLYIILVVCSIYMYIQ